MKRAAFLLVAVFFSLSGVYAQIDASLRVEPRIIIPVATSLPDGTDKFSVGGGLSLQTEIGFPFANWFYAEAVLDAGILPVKNAGKSLQSISLGIGPGVRFVPTSRLVLKSSIYGGAEALSFDGVSTLVPFIEPTVDMDFQVSPSFNLGLGGGYRMIFGNGGTVLQAARVSINLVYNFGVGKSGARIEANPSLSPVYPLYYTYYETHPTGDITIRNEERDSLTDLKVSFYVPQYMDRPQLSKEFTNKLRSGEEVTVPLYGLFNKDIFEVTEGLTVAGEIHVDYKWLGQEFTRVEPVSLDVLNRNAMTWDDDRKAAAYVTSNNPLVKSYSKNIAANVRGDDREVFDIRFRTGMALFEALTLHGTGYVIDPNSAYANLSEDSDTIDFIQFPAETLAYQAGDCDDLSVLYNAMLQAAAIETAFITAPGHIFIAFDLGLNEEQAKKKLPSMDDLIEYNGTYWVPVEVTLVEHGFLEAWRVGAREWREAEEKGNAGFFPTNEAWQVFPPVEYNTGELVFLPDPDEVMEAYGAAVDRLVYQDVTPVVRDLQARIDREGGSPAAYNRIGVVYAKYGLLDEAEPWFRKSVSGRPYPSGEVNLGNVQFLRGDYDSAASHYRKALEADDDNSRALLGLAKASFELEDYDTADTNMTVLASINPGMASHYSYLGTTTDGPVLRASSAATKDVYGWDDDE